MNLVKIINNMPGLFFIFATIYFLYQAQITDIERTVTIPLKMFYLMWMLVFLAWLISWSKAKYFWNKE